MALPQKDKATFKNELQKQTTEEKYVNEIKRMEKKAEVVSFNRYCFKQQLELDTLRANRNKKTNEALNVAETQRGLNFGYEMSKLKREELCDVKRRQQLRENCPELRDLERKLNAAYTNKIVMAQIKEKEARKIEEKLREIDQTEKLQKARIPEKEYFKEVKEVQMKQKEEYKRALQDQMIFQENVRRSKYEEFLKEKKLIDELVLRIQEEDAREYQIKYCDMLKTQEDIRQFKENQEAWRARTKARLAEEDRAVELFIKKKIDESAILDRTRAEKAALKEAFSEEIAKKMYMEQRKQMERTELLNDLWEEEERLKHELKHQEQVEKEIRMRIDTKRSLNAQLQERLEFKQQEAERDAKYLEEMMAHLAKSDKLEQMSAEKRRLKLTQLRRDIEDTIKNNRLKKAMDMQAKLKEQEVAQQEAEKRRLRIEDERIRMIKEHFENLLGYLPAGIISESEMDKLGPDLKKMLLCTDKIVL